MARRWLQATCALLMVIAPSTLHAADTLQWSGFAVLRGTSGPDDLPLRSDSVSAQAQLGIDWRPSMFFAAHVHLLARSEDDDSRRAASAALIGRRQRSGAHRHRECDGTPEQDRALPTAPEPDH